MPKKADPLRNLGASNVFFALARGPKTPSIVASELEITHASASEHLKLLCGIGVIMAGQKGGRLQYYQVDWSNVAKAFFGLSAFTVFRRNVGFTGEVPAPKELDRMDEVASKLKRNGLFLRLLRGYFETVAWTFGDRPQRTVREKLFELEFSLVDVCSTLENSTIKTELVDEKTQEFMSLLEEYRAFYKRWRGVLSAAERSAVTLKDETRLRNHILKNPSVIEKGFRPLETEVVMESGEVVDLVGEDKGGRTVVVEFKHGSIAPSDVRQLDRYVNALTKKSKRRPRGVLVGRDVIRDAKELLNRYGYEFRRIGQGTREAG